MADPAEDRLDGDDLEDDDLSPAAAFVAAVHDGDDGEAEARASELLEESEFDDRMDTGGPLFAPWDKPISLDMWEPDGEPWLPGQRHADLAGGAEPTAAEVRGLWLRLARAAFDGDAFIEPWLQIRRVESEGRVAFAAWLLTDQAWSGARFDFVGAGASEDELRTVVRTSWLLSDDPEEFWIARLAREPVPRAM